MTKSSAVAYERSDDALHDSMVQWFGLPQVREEEFDEVFGWYHVDDYTRYWRHDAKTGQFEVLTSDDQNYRPMLAGTWEQKDLKEVCHQMDALQFLPRPPLPADLTTAISTPPFAYEGWLYAWHFAPALRRWELAVLERRWHPEPPRERDPEIEKSAAAEREDRRKSALSLATKSFDAGARLFERYCSEMLLLGKWIAPGPRAGVHLILGAASEAKTRFDNPTNIIRLVSRATGCSEEVVQHVINYAEYSGNSERFWFSSAAVEVLVPGLGDIM